MKPCLTLLALVSAVISAPVESERQEIPQFLQNLPFFSQLQSLQQSFQNLQANIPADIMSQIQQSLPPFLANILTGQTAPAGRTLQDLQQQLPQLIQSFQELQASLPPEAIQQLQQSLPPFLANIFTNLQSTTATGRADEPKGQTELTEDQGKLISDFVKRCQSLYSSSYGYPTYSSGYSYGYPSYSYNTGYNSGYYPYNGGYNTGYPPYISVTGRSGLERKGDIETKKGGHGKHQWWNKNPYNNYNQKPSYGANYQKPSYGANFQNPYNKPSNFYNPYSNYNPYYQTPYQFQYPNYNYGTIGANGVVIPTTGTGTNTGTIIGTNNGTTTAIRDGPEE